MGCLLLHFSRAQAPAWARPLTQAPAWAARTRGRNRRSWSFEESRSEAGASERGEDARATPAPLLVHVGFEEAGQPVEIAPSYLFLATTDSSYMTGQVLHPNGGRIVNG